MTDVKADRTTSFILLLFLKGVLERRMRRSSGIFLRDEGGVGNGRGDEEKSRESVSASSRRQLPPSNR